ALAEGFDEAEMVIACLLHDIAYCEEFGENGWNEHGRRGAAIARPYLEELGFRKTGSGISATGSPSMWTTKQALTASGRLSRCPSATQTISTVSTPTGSMRS
ncbi:MAG: hypothetical protein IIY46_00885, partial [Lachnospiraceae bacterium]|nr:hypothetical protein [Lachnospiraceae bacterium]